MIWHYRHQLARLMIHAGLRVMPPGRFKQQLLAALWDLRWRVEDEVRTQTILWKRPK